jgi:hypothetical protein
VLDIRAVAYVSPVSEVPFESVPLTVHIVNVADETGFVTGKFRVYNDTTGLLIHTSDIAPFTASPGSTTHASALTDFNPPAPADDVYFVLFDGKATNALVPDGIGIHLSSFYFDVKPVAMGPAPEAHGATHELGGSDALEVSDLATSELDDSLMLSPDGAGGVDWVPGGGGVTDHDDLTNLDYASAGHTGFAPNAHNHQGDDLQFVKVHPNADSTTALQILKANDATVIVDVDSTNKRIGIATDAPVSSLHVAAGVVTIPETTGVEIQGLVVRGASTNLLNYQGLDSTLTYAFFGTNRTYGAGGWSSSGWYGARPAASLQVEDDKVRLWQFAAGSNSNTNVFSIFTGGAASFGTTHPVISDGLGIDVNGKIIRLRTSKTPASAGAAGNAGEICWDADYIYVCIATNTWVRVETQTW